MRTMRYTLPSLIAIAAIAAMASPAQALVCTGTTKPVGLSGSATLTDMSGGNCVSAGDKLFGDASVGGGITGAGSVNFSALTLQGDVTVGFQGTLGPLSSGDITYSVAINPPLAGDFRIHDLEKDFTLNSQPAGTAASATLSGSATFASGSLAFTCNRTVNPNTTTCPVTNFFGLTDAITVNQHIVTETNAVVTGITDTISQAAIPEPASLILLGTNLLALGWFVRRRRSARG